MPKFTVALLLALATPLTFAEVADLQFERRDGLTCVADAAPSLCLKTLELGDGIDVLSQLKRYAELINETAPAQSSPDLTAKDLSDTAAGIGISADQRHALVTRFERLKVVRIAVNLEDNQGEGAAAGERTLPFLAEIEWAERGEPNKIQTTRVQGHLIGNDQEKDFSNQDPAGLNKIFAEMVGIDRVSNEGLEANLIQHVVAPSVLANGYIAVMVPMLEELARKVGEAVGKAFSDTFGQGPNQTPNQTPKN